MSDPPPLAPCRSVADAARKGFLAKVRLQLLDPRRKRQADTVKVLGMLWRDGLMQLDKSPCASEQVRVKVQVGLKSMTQQGSD